MSDIKLNTRGVIISGDHQGSTVIIEDDSENTGGFLILIKPEASTGESSGDYWVENFESLKFFFEEANWKVRWLSET